MKLRNKKTGEILTAYWLKLDLPYGQFDFESIGALNDMWEDYTPQEPLIKDKKIRKAVRAWAEANGYSLVKVGYDMASEPNNSLVQIHFEGSDIVDEDKYGVHTIDELCGEEEEHEA